MDKQLILNKYSKPEDKLLISKMLDKIELSKSKNRIEYTDFLDAYHKHLLEKILPIVCIRINLPKEMYAKYSHRDYLGGLMKLGIKREKVGDIFVFKDGADILVLDEISKFLLNNLSTLTRFSKSKIEKVSIENIRQKEVNKEELKVIVSSMRLDCVVSELLKTSRGQAEEIIKEQRVFVNFENVDKLTKQIKESDLITVRGKGRFEISKIEGTTRNDRVKLIVNKFI